MRAEVYSAQDSSEGDVVNRSLKVCLTGLAALWLLAPQMPAQPLNNNLHLRLRPAASSPAALNQALAGIKMFGFGNAFHLMDSSQQLKAGNNLLSPALTPAARFSAILAGTSLAIVPVTLSPAHPVVSNVAGLDLLSPNGTTAVWFDANPPYIVLSSGPQGERPMVAMTMSGTAGKLYLIDANLYAFGSNCQIVVQGPASDLQQFNCQGSSQHVLVAYQATTTGYASFGFSLSGDNASARFYSVKIAQLN